MEKILTAILTLSLIFLMANTDVYARELGAGSSAALSKNIAQEATDSRVRILREFLEKYKSPLAPFAGNFVENADKYNIDWKLVAAISGVESTFGQQIPSESFNGWGWGIYGDNVIRFSSWKDGIETVSEGLRTNYINKWGAQDVWEIGKIYAASPTWAQRVTYFMAKIDEFKNKELANNQSYLIE